MRKRLQNILFKEWHLLFTDINSALIITLLPVLIVGQGILYIWLAYRFAGTEMLYTPIFQTALERFATAIPTIFQLAEQDRLLAFLLYQFNFWMLLIPVMIAVSVATFSIVEEKVTGTLEALLATPVRTWELLLAKALAGAIPALLVTWFCAGIYLLIVALLGWGYLCKYIITANWFLALFLLTPAVAILSFMLGVIGSSRARDAKSAQNLVVIVIFPILAFIVIQVTGVIWFTPFLTTLLILLLILADIIILRIAVKLFRRESILTEWR